MFGKGQLLERWKFHFFKAGSERIVRSSSVVSGFSREVDGICALLSYYAAYCCNSLLTFRVKLSFHLQRPKISKRIAKPLVFLIPEDRTDSLSRNVRNDECETYRFHLQESITPRKTEFLDFSTLQAWTDRLYPKVGKYVILQLNAT
jgi:hypothetical protein